MGSIFFLAEPSQGCCETCASTLFPCQSQYRFVCEAILKVYEEGLVKPLKTAIYQHREKVEEEKKHGEGEEMSVTDEGEPVAADSLEGVEDEEDDDDDDDDEEVEVLDVGEVTEDDEEEEEEVEEPSVASATSVTSETSANPEADPAANP